jgi:20S proteasome subunit alpha 6
MQSECLSHRYVYGQAIPPHQLMADLADKHQRTTQMYVRRPFGVGMLIASIDESRGTPHFYQTCPSGNLYEFYASAIGARSQSAKTYLEKHYESFPEASRDDLIVHALQALQGCCSGDNELTKDNGSIVVVGKDEKFTLIEGDELQQYLNRLEVVDNNDAEEEEQPQEGEAGGEPMEES